MKLTTVQASDFQSILNSGEFKLGDITCLVGKNEAGKTAVLQALYRLNPIVDGDGVYSVTDDYPRWNVEDYRLDVEAGRQKPATVVTAVFELDAEEVRSVEALVGANALKTPHHVTLSKGYDNQRHARLDVDANAALRHVASQLSAP